MNQAAQGGNPFPIDYMCRMLGVSRQGYYAWRNRGPSQRERDNVTLKTKIKVLFEFHKKRY